MATEMKQAITEWECDPLTPKMVFLGEDEFFGKTILVGCPEAGEVAVHVGPGEEDVTSVYMTPTEALLLAERIKTSALIAQKLQESK